MRKTLTACAAALALAGCAAPTTITSHFNPAEVSWASAQGANTITGSAVIRTRGGEARTCAASRVELVPDSTFARERMQALYGSTERGYNQMFMGRRISASNDDARFGHTIRAETCDAQGMFVFSQLPDGAYFVITQVTWEVGGSYVPEGGYLMQRVTVANGETRRVILSP